MGLIDGGVPKAIRLHVEVDDDKGTYEWDVLFRPEELSAQAVGKPDTNRAVIASYVGRSLTLQLRLRMLARPSDD